MLWEDERTKSIMTDEALNLVHGGYICTLTGADISLGVAHKAIYGGIPGGNPQVLMTEEF